MCLNVSFKIHFIWKWLCPNWLVCFDQDLFWIRLWMGRNFRSWKEKYFFFSDFFFLKWEAKLNHQDSALEVLEVKIMFFDSTLMYKPVGMLKKKKQSWASWQSDYISWGREENDYSQGKLFRRIMSSVFVEFRKYSK